MPNIRNLEGLHYYQTKKTLEEESRRIITKDRGTFHNVKGSIHQEHITSKYRKEKTILKGETSKFNSS